MTRFGEISPLWPKVNNLWQTLYGSFSVWQHFEPTLAKLYGFWKHFEPTLAKLYGFGGNLNCCKWQSIEK